MPRFVSVGITGCWCFGWDFIARYFANKSVIFRSWSEIPRPKRSVGFARPGHLLDPGPEKTPRQSGMSGRRDSDFRLCCRFRAGRNPDGRWKRGGLPARWRTLLLRFIRRKQDAKWERVRHCEWAERFADGVRNVVRHEMCDGSGMEAPLKQSPCKIQAPTPAFSPVFRMGKGGSKQDSSSDPSFSLNRFFVEHPAANRATTTIPTSKQNMALPMFLHHLVDTDRVEGRGTWLFQ